MPNQKNNQQQQVHLPSTTSPDVTGQPLRKTRRDKGTIMATPRDLHIIAWIAHQYACRQDHLRELLSREAGAPTKDDLIALSTLKDQIDRWQKAGWVEYKRYLAGEPGWAWVTRAGLHLVGLDDLYLGKAPAPVRYHHIWAVNEVRLFWWDNDDVEEDEENKIEAEWISERQLRAEMTVVKKRPDHIPAAIQIAEGMIPDAVIIGKRWVAALEIELTPKKPEDTREKLERLCRATYRLTSTGREYIYNNIHFYVPSRGMQQHIERARAHLDEMDKARVEVHLDEDLGKKH
ncbi:MAG: hypothetical protein ACRDHZ_00320 [Ktedonobacteraceae bacterium]